MFKELNENDLYTQFGKECCIFHADKTATDNNGALWQYIEIENIIRSKNALRCINSGDHLRNRAPGNDDVLSRDDFPFPRLIGEAYFPRRENFSCSQFSFYLRVGKNLMCAKGGNLHNLLLMLFHD